MWLLWSVDKIALHKYAAHGQLNKLIQTVLWKTRLSRPAQENCHWGGTFVPKSTLELIKCNFKELTYYLGVIDAHRCTF